jgi:insertion element IS1 protein InsB
VAYVNGGRSEATCKKLWDRIPNAYRNCRTFSDFWKAYASVFSEAHHLSVGKETGETAHMERWNNTLRQRVGRMVRKTLSFSKDAIWHDGVIHWFVVSYNSSLSVNV